MVDPRLGNVRVLGVGHLGVAVASFFSGETHTAGMDYDSESIKYAKVDRILQLKEFDGRLDQNIDKALTKEKRLILDSFSGNLIFVIAQIEGRFQEVIIPSLFRLLKTTGAFIGFFPIIPIGADRKRAMEKVLRVKKELDMLEFVDSENVLSDSKNQRVLDINNQYYRRIWQKVMSIAKVVDNSTALGISLHDIKMLTNLYGPALVSSFTYPFVNFSIAERDLFEEVNKIPRERIKRIYMVLEIGSEVDSNDVILFVRRVRNSLGNVDFRQGFIHTHDNFGLIVLNFGSF